MTMKTKARACDGKRRHDTRAQAEGQMWALIRHGASPAAVNVYECRHCTKFHVGHRPRRRR